MSHELLLTLVVDTAKARRRIREAGGGVLGVERVLRLEVEAMTTALGTHSVSVEEWLPEAGLLNIVRAAFDPASAATTDRQQTGAPTESERQNEPEPAACSVLAAPMAVEEHWTYVRTDTGFHQTFWIAEWPRQKVFPGFLHPLIYVGEFRHTVTEVIRAVPTTEALRDIRSAQEAHETRRRINTRFDRPLTREQRAEEEEVAQREEEIVAGHGDVRPAAYVTITAATIEDLAGTGKNWSRPPREPSLNCGCWLASNGQRSWLGHCRSGGGYDEALNASRSVHASGHEAAAEEGNGHGTTQAKSPDP
jgi:hypothetical protein